MNGEEVLDGPKGAFDSLAIGRVSGWPPQPKLRAQSLAKAKAEIPGAHILIHVAAFLQTRFSGFISDVEAQGCLYSTSPSFASRGSRPTSALNLLGNQESERKTTPKPNTMTEPPNLLRCHRDTVLVFPTRRALYFQTEKLRSTTVKEVPFAFAAIRVQL